MEWGKPWGSIWGAEPDPGDFIDYFVQRGTQTLLSAWTVSWSEYDLDIDLWSLSTPSGAAPIVAFLEFVDGDDTKIQIKTDQTLLPGTEYTLTTTALPTGMPDPPSAITFIAKPIAAEQSDKNDGLVDIENDPFGEYKVTAGGDHSMRGGYATYRKLIIDRVLARRYTLYWATEYGSQLGHKRPRPDLRNEEKKLQRELLAIPTTVKATVKMLFENRHLRISVDCRSTLGIVREELTV